MDLFVNTARESQRARREKKDCSEVFVSSQCVSHKPGLHETLNPLPEGLEIMVPMGTEQLPFRKSENVKEHLKPASPFYRKERKNQSAKEKVKYGWSKEEAPSEISGCFSSELSMQQVLEKSLLENTFTKQQKANLRFEFHGLGKKAHVHIRGP
ncbi:hypothetical protein Anapl_00451 [Anas platyrhynchos]|uniref:Uncharacterized protein n=1 Tax=Anas platyrhynchos TaxID=8839 RepID=R0JUQ9_ANAPL|nr:hypothetical protein Anapl_00451 [Anas platyrhynchos]